MPDYRGSPNADNIDQTILGLADNTFIYGEAGNDTIAFGNAVAIGGAGNDTIIGRTAGSILAYWTSTSGVTVNLATGTASDGLGGTDTISGILHVQGSSFDDTLIGSGANETFRGARGNNTINGGGGYDIAQYTNQKSTSAVVTYNAATDTFTVTKNFTDGDKGVDTLTGIEQISFLGAGSDNTSYTRESFTGNFRQQPTAFYLGLNMAGGHLIDAARSGDFNGDGKADILLSQMNGLGVDLQPTIILSGDGHGGFTDITSATFASGSFLNKGGAVYVGDLNNDGISDIFHLNFGLDLDVDGGSVDNHDGGTNTIALSNAATGKLVNTSAALTAPPGRNHRAVLADFTGDGYLDAVIQVLDQGQRYLINDGHGGFTDTGESRLPSYVASAHTNVYLASGAFDADGDGTVDLILNHNLFPGAAESVVLLNPGNGDFSSVTPVMLPQSGLREEVITDSLPIDLNGDGLPDMVRSVTTGGYGASDYYQTSYLQFLVNEGAGHFRDVTASTLPQSLPNNGGWYKTVTVTDFNRDGHSDILVNRAGSGAPTPGLLFLNNGNGTFTADQTFSGEPVAIDANGDGMTDIVSVTNSGTVVLHLNAMANQHTYKAEFGEAVLRGSGGDDVMSDRQGNTSFWAGAGNDTITGGSGNDVIDGGSGIDTALFTGNRAAYTVTQTSAGNFTVTGADGTDTLTNVEFAKFDDQTMRLLPGEGVTAPAFTAAPATYMAGIRDFDGNNLTGQGTQRIDPGTGALVGGGPWDGVSGWTLAGAADVSGGGLQSRILFNNQVGRWAEVTTQTDGKVYFNNHGWAGDTRIVGIYIDPLVQSGAVVAGSATDSQRRFQNDLFIGNLKDVLHAADYDKDGGQEIYFSLTDGTAYLHTYMHADGNIRYANYQSKSQVQDYLAANGFAGSTTWLAAAPPEKPAAAWSDDAPPLMVAAAEPPGFRDLIAPDNSMLMAAGG